MTVPFLDLNAQYAAIREEIAPALQAVLDSCAFTGGPFVKEFEDAFAAAHDCRFCCGVASGTAALHLALWGAGIGPGDEVIVPANTFFATPEAVSLCGATPVFVDCEPAFYNLDPARIEAAITRATKAIIPVHLYGQPANLEAITAIAATHNLLVIEDCAQAHLAKRQGKFVGGTQSLAGCWSFYPGKNLGAYGEAGAITTNDETLYTRICMLRDHGSPRKYHHDLVGQNYRMDGFQGAVLGVKLKHLPAWTQERRRAGATYRQLLADVNGVTLPAQDPASEHVYHLFVIRVADRDGLIAHLQEHGIACGIHYPVPCHKQPAYAHLGYTDDACPQAEQIAGEIVSLPLYPELTDTMIATVCDAIREFLA